MQTNDLDSEELTRKIDPGTLGRFHLVSSLKVPVREVRVAVSMVGGTSLAIYEHGVTQELFRMVHGQGVYGLLKRITQSHALIDIVSGTSAGGINGVGLCAALTSGADIEPMRQVWIVGADIDKLLQNPHNVDVTSILKGDSYYFPVVQQLFRKLSSTEPGKAPDFNDEPTVPSGWWDNIYGAASSERVYGELDLFVTGTFYEPMTNTFFDSRNKGIFNHDYAGVFHFKHRPERGESHFRADCSEEAPLGQKAPRETKNDPNHRDSGELRQARISERLARVARTTSSLPALFEPSAVDPQLMGAVISTPSPNRPVHMVDGGFLNNRPLGLVLDEIARRPATREILRKVLFVEPAAENRDSGVGAGEKPNALQNVAFYFDVPHRQSLSVCLDTIKVHNQKAAKLTEVMKSVRRCMNAGRDVTPQQNNLWAEICLQNLRDRIVGVWTTAEINRIPPPADPAPDPLGIRPLLNASALQPSAPRASDREGDIEKLRVLRSRLFAKMRSCCLDFESENRDLEYQDGLAENIVDLLAEPILGNPPPANPEQDAAARRIELIQRGCFSIEHVDPTYIIRKADHAIDEIYRTLFPQIDYGDISQSDLDSDGQPQPQSEQELRRLTYDAMQPVYPTVLGILRQLNHVKELAIIVVTTMRHMLESMIHSEPYLIIVRHDLLINDGNATQDAEPRELDPTIDGRVDKLWAMLSSCVYRLLGSASVPLQPSSRDDLADWNIEREAVTVKKALEAACQSISGAIAYKPAGTEAGEIAPADPRTLLLGQLEDRIDFLVARATSLLAPGAAILEREAAKTQERQADGGITPPSISVPLQWASNIVQHYHRWEDAAPEIGRAMRRMDVHLLPIEHVTDTAGRQRIELVYVTPRDCQLGSSRETPDNKLAGDVLGNLGGFLKRSWRVNDIMWGRLDASGAIVEMLLDRARIIRLLDSGGNKRIFDAIENYVKCGGVGMDISKPDKIGKLLASEWDENAPKIESWLMNGYDKTRSRLTDDQEFCVLRDILLRRAQMEILLQEVPDAIAEAVSEAAQWQARGDTRSIEFNERGDETAINRAFLGSQKSEEPDVVADSITAIPNLSKFIGILPSASEVDAMRRYAKVLAMRTFGMGPERISAPEDIVSPQKVGAYFDQGYAIGSESVAENIPPLVSIRRMLAALIISLNVLDNCIPDSIKEGAFGKILSKYLLGPLRFVAGGLLGFLTTLGQGTRLAIMMHTAAWLLILGGMALCIYSQAPRPVLIPAIAVALIGEGLVAWATSQPALVALMCCIAAAIVTPWQNLAHKYDDGDMLRWAIVTLFLITAFVMRLAQGLGWKNFLVIGKMALVTLVSMMGLAYLYTSFAGNSVPAIRLPDGILLRDLIVGAAGIVVFGAASSYLSKALTNNDAPKGIISLELAGTPEEAMRITSSWNVIKGGKRPLSVAAQNLLWDNPLVLSYTAFLMAACTVASWPIKAYAMHFPISIAWLDSIWSLIVIAQIIAGLIDAFSENYGMRRLIRIQALRNITKTPEEQTPLKALAAQWRWRVRVSAIAKFALIFAGLIYCLTGAVAYSYLGPNTRGALFSRIMPKPVNPHG